MQVECPTSSPSGPLHNGMRDAQSNPDPPHPDHSTHHERRRPLVTTLGWDIKAIIASSPNFHHMRRIHYSSPAARTGITEYEKDGIPTIIHGWNRHPRWPKSMFNVEWLKKNGDQNPTVRNVHDWTDFKITIDDFIQKLRKSSLYASADEQERLYGKDGECPAAWTEWLTEGHAIPKELLFDGSNDFLKFLPDTAKVQTLMCYMGIGDTFTPFHKDLCASSGQNLMCYTEHAGSSFWFMTKASVTPQVAAYFHQLGQELDLETHVVTIEELAKAPFDVYIAEQQIGDLVLVPPRSCHQVVNKGGITIKTSWSRMSLDGLQTALWNELPIYHRVCRQEIYKVKSNIFHAAQHFTGVLETLPENSAQRETCAETLKQLVVLFDDVLASDYSTTHDSMPHVSYSGSVHIDDLHCDFCGADIFQSFFECDSCVPSSPSQTSSDILTVGDGLVLCPLCYVEGRTCRCGEAQPVQCRPFSDLLQIRDRAVRAIRFVDNSFTTAYGYLSEQPSRLLREQAACVFEAACKLFQQQQSVTTTTRSCRARSTAHQVPVTAAIYCKPCHSSKCYTHLLEANSIHSITALSSFDPQNADTAWHQLHRNCPREFEDSRRRVIKDEEMGTRPNMLHRLTYLAKTFTTCRAIKPELTKHGWYDQYAQTNVIPIASSPVKVLVGLPTNERVIAEESASYQTSIRRTPDSIININDPISQQGIASREASLVASGSPFVTRKPPSRASVQSLITDDLGSVSDLTDIPTEFDSSPLIRPIISVVVDSEALSPPAPTKPSISMPPVPAISSSSYWPLATSMSEQRVVLDYVEIPRPEWYKKMRASVAVSSSPGKRKQPEGSLSEDDMPVEQLRRPAPPSALRRRPGPFLLSPLSSDVPEAAGPSNTSVSCRSAPVKQPLPSQSLSPRKRKISQTVASRLPSSRKHARTSFLPNANILASALNNTFQHNSTSESCKTPTSPVTTSAVASVNNPLSICNPQRYKDVAIQTSPRIRFTRKTTNVTIVDQPNCIERLEQRNRLLENELAASQWECRSLQERLEMMSTLYGQLARPQPVITPLPTAPTSHAAPLSGRQVRCVTPDNQPHPMHNQEPQHPATEPLRPLTLPSQETHRRLPNSVHAPLPPRRPTPTRPRSFERAATWGGALQGNRGYDHHGQHDQRRSSFGMPWSGSGRGRDRDKGRTRPASPPATHPSLSLRLSGLPAQSVQPTEDPIPTSALFTVEDGPTVFLASTPQRCD